MDIDIPQITVDENYSPTSTNPQSGIAISQAITSALENIPTSDDNGNNSFSFAIATQQGGGEITNTLNENDFPSTGGLLYIFLHDFNENSNVCLTELFDNMPDSCLWCKVIIKCNNSINLKIESRLSHFSWAGFSSTLEKNDRVHYEDENTNNIEPIRGKVFVGTIYNWVLGNEKIEVCKIADFKPIYVGADMLQTII